MWGSAAARSSHTTTPLPAARPSALTTSPVPVAASSPAKSSAASSSPSTNARARAIRTPGRRGDARDRTPCSSRSGRPPGSARRPGPRRRPAASATPAASGASGPITTSSAEVDRAAATTASASSGWTSGRQRTRGSVPIAAPPGATNTWLTPGSPRQLPGQRVLASAAPDDQDPGRHDREAHPRAAPGPRAPRDLPRCAVAVPARVRAPSGGGASGGRPARSSGVRSGPTETSTIGTPAASSSAAT